MEQHGDPDEKKAYDGRSDRPFFHQQGERQSDQRAGVTLLQSREGEEDEIGCEKERERDPRAALEKPMSDQNNQEAAEGREQQQVQIVVRREPEQVENQFQTDAALSLSAVFGQIVHPIRPVRRRRFGAEQVQQREQDRVDPSAISVRRASATS